MIPRRARNHSAAERFTRYYLTKINMKKLIFLLGLCVLTFSSVLGAQAQTVAGDMSLDFNVCLEDNGQLSVTIQGTASPEVSVSAFEISILEKVCKFEEEEFYTDVNLPTEEIQDVDGNYLLTVMAGKVGFMSIAQETDLYKYWCEPVGDDVEFDFDKIEVISADGNPIIVRRNSFEESMEDIPLCDGTGTDGTDSDDDSDSDSDADSDSDSDADGTGTNGTDADGTTNTDIPFYSMSPSEPIVVTQPVTEFHGASLIEPTPAQFRDAAGLQETGPKETALLVVAAVAALAWTLFRFRKSLFKITN